MFRLTLRELFLGIALAAVSLGWGIEHYRTAPKLREAVSRVADLEITAQLAVDTANQRVNGLDLEIGGTHYMFSSRRPSVRYIVDEEGAVIDEVELATPRTQNRR